MSEGAQAAASSRRYKAFISYRHADNKEAGRQWASWLHQALETYEVPAELVGMRNERGEIIPDRLFPIFRDEEELPVDAELESPIYRALDHSDHLLVICSPRAVASRYVAAEISYFKRIGKDERILALMVDGEPNASLDSGKQQGGIRAEQECFPKPLQFEVDAKGQLTDRRTEPIAADFRLLDERTGEHSQGWTSPAAYRQALRDAGESGREAEARVREYRDRIELMKLKIIAGLLGVPLGELTRRDEAYQLQKARRRQRVLAGVVLLVSVLAILAVVAGVFAWQERGLAIANEALAEQRRVEAHAQKRASQRNEARLAWLPRAGNAGTERRYPDNVLFAARALGFRGFGFEGLEPEEQAWLEARYPPLVHAEDGELFEAFGDLIELSPKPMLPIWSSPSRRLHGDSLVGLAYSEDGRFLATAAQDRTLALWDTQSGERLWQQEFLRGNVISLCFSPDDALIACNGLEGGVVLRRREDGQVVKRLSGSVTALDCLDWSPDGRLLVGGEVDGKLNFWDVESGRLLAREDAGLVGVYTLSFSPDGSLLATGSWNNTVQLWDPKTRQRVHELAGHTQPVKCLSFSPDGRLLASGSIDRSIRLWDVAERKALERFRDHEEEVWQLAFSPDSQRLVSASKDRQLHVRELSSGRLLGQLKTANTIFRLAIAPGGERLAYTAGHGSVHFRELDTLAFVEAGEGHLAHASQLAWSPDGLTFASASYDGSLRLWSSASGELLRVFEGHTDRVRALAYHPQGRLLYSGGEDGFVLVWDLASGEIQKRLELPEAVTSLAISGNGHWLAAGCEDLDIYRWNLSEGVALPPLKGHGHDITRLLFSPDSHLLASCSWDKTVRLWRLRDGTPLQVLEGHNRYVHDLAFRPDGQQLASASSDSTVKLWDVYSGELISSQMPHATQVRALAWSPDGFYLASASMSDIRIWDTDTRNGRMRGFIRAIAKGHGGRLTGLDWSPDGQALLSASSDGSLRLWDVAFDRTIGGQDSVPSRSISRLAWSPDGQRLALAGWDGSVHLLWTRTGRTQERVLELGDGLKCLQWSPDGHLLAMGTEKGTLVLWSVEEGGDPYRLVAHEEAINDLAFHPDGKQLATASSDTTIRLWELATHRPLQTLRGHRNPVETLAWEASGERLASGSWEGELFVWKLDGYSIEHRIHGSSDITSLNWQETGGLLAGGTRDGAIMLWDPQREALLATLTGHERDVFALDFHPDGQRLVSAAHDGRIYVWDLERQEHVLRIPGMPYAQVDLAFSPNGEQLALATESGYRLWSVPALERPDLASYLSRHYYRFGGLNEEIRSEQHDQLYRELRFPMLNAGVWTLPGVLEQGKTQAQANRALFDHYLRRQRWEAAQKLLQAPLDEPPSEDLLAYLQTRLLKARAGAQFEKLERELEAEAQ